MAYGNVFAEVFQNLEKKNAKNVIFSLCISNLFYKINLLFFSHFPLNNFRTPLF